MNGRTFESEGYRYGFNGQEKDDDAAKGSYTAEFWHYSPSIGRRWNTDPVEDIGVSPYATFADNPILFNDPNGDCPKCNTEDYTPGQSDTWSYDENGKGTHWFLQNNGEWLDITGKDASLYRGNKSIKWSGNNSYDAAGTAGSNKNMAAIASGEKAIKDLHFVGHAATATLAIPALSTFRLSLLGRNTYLNVGGELLNQVIANGGDLSKIDKIDLALSAFSFNLAAKHGVAAVFDWDSSGPSALFFGKSAYDTSIDFFFGFAGEKASSIASSQKFAKLAAPFSPSLWKKSVVKETTITLQRYKWDNFGILGGHYDWKKPVYRVETTRKTIFTYKGIGKNYERALGATIDLYGKVLGGILKTGDD